MTMKKKIFISVLVWAVFAGIPAVLLVSTASGKEGSGLETVERFDPVMVARESLSEQQLENIKDSYLSVVYEPEQKVCWLVRANVGYGGSRFCASYNRE